jgi:FkbM family methyltransferase
MKLVYDVIGAAPRSGGVELHAREFIHAWTEQYPGDEVVVVGTRWDGLSDEFASRVRWIHWPTRSVVWRIIGQLVFIPLVMRVHRAHVLLVSLPVLSPLSPSRRSFVFSHDWRHLRNPHEFPFLRRIYRSIWRSSVNRAAITFCISAKALSETADVAPRSRLVLAENGSDHTLRWEAEPADSEVVRSLPAESSVVVTFGHLNNKRPELVIAAMSTLQRPAVQLVVLGARGGYRDDLRKLAKSHRVSERVHLPGFVPDREYQAIMKRADCVVLASSDEGFGLPVAEALSLGRPVVVTADGGLDETFGSSVRAVPATPEALGGAIGDALLQRATASQQSNVTSWGDTARVVREAIATKVEGDFPVSTQRAAHRRIRDTARKARKVAKLVTESRWRRALRFSVAATVEHDGIPLRHDLRTVIDVGANRGQFSLYALARFPSATITTYEPLPRAVEHMKRLFNGEHRVQVVPYALGEEEGEVVMHLSAREDSSSLLPVGERQASIFPGTDEVGTTRAQVRTLDMEFVDRELVRPALLKIDVQGFELSVLRGAQRTLASFDQILVEASFAELYEGQALFPDIHRYLEERGFRLVSGHVSTLDPSGRWLQGDFLYEPESARR